MNSRVKKIILAVVLLALFVAIGVGVWWWYTQRYTVETEFGIVGNEWIEEVTQEVEVQNANENVSFNQPKLEYALKIFGVFADKILVKVGSAQPEDQYTLYLDDLPVYGSKLQWVEPELVTWDIFINPDHLAATCASASAQVVSEEVFNEELLQANDTLNEFLMDSLVRSGTASRYATTAEEFYEFTDYAYLADEFVSLCE